MKYGINKATLVGIVGDNPVFTKTDEKSWITFPLATPETYRDKDGFEVTKKIWHKCIAYKNTAKLLKEYVKAGDSIYIEGKIVNSIWKDNWGNEHVRTDIEIDNFLFLKPKKPKTDEESIQEIRK